MKRLALKFGGTSVGTIDKIKNVANIVKKRVEEGNEVIVIVSAMSGITNDLTNKSNLISKNFDSKELDVLLSSGEQASCSLLAGALINLGLKARSWLGWQIPIITNNNDTIVTNNNDTIVTKTMNQNAINARDNWLQNNDNIIRLTSGLIIIPLNLP